MSVTISVPSLDALTLTGSGVIAVSDIEAASLTVRSPGSGVLRASGAATKLDVTLDGSGDAQLEQLIAVDARAVVSGSGRIVLTATQSLDASVPGSGAIMYGGNPREVTRSITGSGESSRPRADGKSVRASAHDRRARHSTGRARGTAARP